MEEQLIYFTGLIVIWALKVGFALGAIVLLCRALMNVKLVRDFVDLQKFPKYFIRVWNKTDEDMEEVATFCRRHKLHKRTHFRIASALFGQIRRLKKLIR